MLETNVGTFSSQVSPIAPEPVPTYTFLNDVNYSSPSFLIFIVLSPIFPYTVTLFLTFKIKLSELHCNNDQWWSNELVKDNQKLKYCNH